MKKVVILALLLISALYFLPIRSYLLTESEQNSPKEHTVSHVQKSGEPQDKIEQNSTKSTQDSENEEQVSQKETKTTEDAPTITVSLNGTATSMTLEDYVAGVAAAEMPASFPMEALKAQAIAARTLRRPDRSKTMMSTQTRMSATITPTVRRIWTWTRMDKSNGAAVRTNGALKWNRLCRRRAGRL